MIKHPILTIILPTKQKGRYIQIITLNRGSFRHDMLAGLAHFPKRPSEGTSIS